MEHDELYSTMSLTVGQIIGQIRNGLIAIPELQRPFVWKPKQVRDLLDSLYKGYPTGYLIIWNNPSVKLRDGSQSGNKQILIDGQQRITALMTALEGQEVFNDLYEKKRIRIAFNPFAAKQWPNNPDAEIFAVQTPAHLRSSNWISDIGEIFKDSFSEWSFIPKYIEKNPNMSGDELNKILNELKAIKNRQLGVIKLNDTIDIETVTDIFIRINSKGKRLSVGDFVMSKIAIDDKHDGNVLRRAIDSFAHMAVVPSYANELRLQRNNGNFVDTDYFKKMEWLAQDNTDIFDPSCEDIIRVSFMHKKWRSKLADLVSLLSGRNFDTREYEEKIVEQIYCEMKEGFSNFIAKDNFKNFVLAITGIGFISAKLVKSSMALDFAYTLYLILHDRHKVNRNISPDEYKRIVGKWYVLSILTGRYSSSPESQFYSDLQKIKEQGVLQTLRDIEDATLSDAFWDNKLVQELVTTSTTEPVYLVFVASLIAKNTQSLLSRTNSVRELVEQISDVHHIFPKQYLIDNHFEKQEYNQVANFSYLDNLVNKTIGKDAPNVYFRKALEQCDSKKIECGSITEKEEFYKNLRENCIPKEIVNMDYTNYEEFLIQRRVMMAQKIKDYYLSL